MRRRLATVIGAVLLTLSVGMTTACEPVPGRVAIAGDSVPWQALDFTGNPHGWDDYMKVAPGVQAEWAQPQVTADRDDVLRSPECLVTTFGHNDAGWTEDPTDQWDGITETDWSQYYGLILTPDDNSKTLVVKPHYAGTDPVALDLIAQWNARIDGLVAALPDRVVPVDWAAVAQPGDIVPDGVHLTEQGGQRYIEMINEALEAENCDLL